jgi:hypothetical protein
MKTFIFFILVSLFAFSCTKNAKKELTAEQKSAIIEEITRQFELSGEGITELDAEKTFSAFSKKEGVKYVRDGHLYPNIETAKQQYAEWFKSPDAIKRKMTCDPLIFDILDENTVLMTTIGILVAMDTTLDQKPWTIAYTGLWRKEPEGWKLFNMHNSWE